uniref:3-oxo-5-alpha-steroid 4-dehydrogenase n=1 Tax=Ciona savignyi TaxID=51511 RepID=H2ZL32_CIOSA
MFDSTTELTVIRVMSGIICSSGILALLAYLGGIPTGYGKHRKDSETSMDARLGWVVQECPSFFIPVYVVYSVGYQQINLANLIIIGAFAFHYFQRTFVYTLLMHKKSTPIPIRLVCMGFTFTSINALAISNYEASHAPLPDSWLSSYQFIGGMLLWGVGMLVNLHSDHVLRNLRRPNEVGYKIPRGGAFELVSGANFSGEILEWIGLKIASNFHFPLVCFALSTALVIGTRALAHHKFYLKKFENYPKSRKAVVPFLL